MSSSAPRVVWSAPAPGDDLRSRFAIIGPFKMTVWRAEAGVWRWEAAGVRFHGLNQESVPAYYSAPTFRLAMADAAAWALANAAHAKASGRPPSVRAMDAGEVRTFLANPGGAAFMVEPDPHAIAAADDILAKRRARFAALEAEAEGKPAPVAPAPSALEVEAAAAEYRHHAEGEDMPAPTRALAPSDSSLTRDSSWVIIRKADGAVIMETHSRAVADAINLEAYRVVSIMEHLQGINAAIRAGA